ncbi:MAG: hypothetical protein N2595_06645, partial [bacterium]|nr:hypothetical protein [bacterium]
MNRPGSLKWRWRRFCAMPWREVAYRGWQWAMAKEVRRRILEETLPAPLTEVVAGADTVVGRLPGRAEGLTVSAEYMEEIMAAGDEVCAHRAELFGRTVVLGEEVDWYRDYLHGECYPRVAWWEIDYRREDGGVDVMAVWWLNRHQHLMPAAIAYYVTGNEGYAEEVLKQLESWLTACEYPYGPGWLTGIEVGVRLVTWSWLYRFLFGRGRPRCCHDTMLFAWFRAIRQHVRYIMTHWARYSSANNHVIAEAAGVLSAMATWPVLFGGKREWGRAMKILEREVRRQVSGDGVDLEQSTS